MASNPRKPRFVVGLDFGTTFTGVAWAFSGNSEDVEVITKWPNTGRTSEKFPTELLYAGSENNCVQTDSLGRRKYSWGYGINYEKLRNQEPLRWFKILLHDKSHSFADEFANMTFRNQSHLSMGQTKRVAESTPAAKTAKQLERLGIEPVDVVTDFLKSLREYIVQVLQRRYQAQFIDTTKIEYVLSVPAVWSDSAKGLTISAAMKAGFGEHEVDFKLVGEPEAAAAYTLQAIQPNSLNIGNNFVVCDAGGGTVDLISYEIENLNPLSVGEAVAGSGDLCGSVFLNQRFEEFVCGKLGRAFEKMKPRARREMMRTWEDNVKFKFADSPDEDTYEVSVPGVPDDEDLGVEQNFLTLTRNEVRSIFDPVIRRIIELVEEQIEGVERKGGDVEAILLVGGFGASEYLHKCLVEKFFHCGKVQVLQPKHAWSAIVRGALQRGLEHRFVETQVARRHYGVSHSSRYDPEIHSERGKYFCQYEGVYKVRDQITWYVKKNMKITKKQTISFDFYRNVDIGNCLVFSDQLLACNDDLSPTWNDTDRVFPVCTLSADLSVLPTHLFPRYVGISGKKYWKVSYSLEMTIVSGIIGFSLMYEGKSYGRIETKFY